MTYLLRHAELKLTMSFLVSVAPMMACTDRHDRYFLRLIAPSVQLYTEMITAQAVLHGDRARLLDFHPTEKYLALQLGGHDPAVLAEAACIAEAWGYDEINFNAGCPSDRVKAGRFGACLMYEPALVAECVSAMQSRVQIPVTVKCRIGVDHQDSYEFLHAFIQQISQAGCNKVIVHARKAWLSGLSPKQNRTIPPLRYDVVRQVKQDFPQLIVILNGGIINIEELEAERPYVDGVMLGRAAYANPYFLAEIEQRYYKKESVLTRHEVIEKILPYIQAQIQKGVRLSSITRHLLGLFQGQRGAAAWRRHLSQFSHLSGADIQVVREALRLTLS